MILTPTPDDIRQAVAFLDQSAALHGTRFMVAALVAWGAGMVTLVEYVRLGFRDRTHAVALTAILYLFADDIAYTLLYDRWFNQIDHSFFRNMWIGFWLSTLFEVTTIYTILRYSRDELFFGMSFLQALIAFVALQALTLALLLWLNYEMRDFFFFTCPLLCNVAQTVTPMWLLIRRRTRRGQSLILAGALIPLNVATSFFLFPLMSPRFDTLPAYALGAGLTLFAVAYFILLRRAPAYHPTAEMKQSV